MVPPREPPAPDRTTAPAPELKGQKPARCRRPRRGGCGRAAPDVLRSGAGEGCRCSGHPRRATSTGRCWPRWTTWCRRGTSTATWRRRSTCPSCASWSATATPGGRPSLDPVVFFKLQLVLFFEGLRQRAQARRDGQPAPGPPLVPGLRPGRAAARPLHPEQDPAAAWAWGSSGASSSTWWSCAGGRAGVGAGAVLRRHAGAGQRRRGLGRPPAGAGGRRPHRGPLPRPPRARRAGCTASVPGRSSPLLLSGPPSADGGGRRATRLASDRHTGPPTGWPCGRGDPVPPAAATSRPGGRRPNSSLSAAAESRIASRAPTSPRSARCTGAFIVVQASLPSGSTRMSCPPVSQTRVASAMLGALELLLPLGGVGGPDQRRPGHGRPAAAPACPPGCASTAAPARRRPSPWRGPGSTRRCPTARPVCSPARPLGRRGEVQVLGPDGAGHVGAPEEAVELHRHHLRLDGRDARRHGAQGLRGGRDPVP